MSATLILKAAWILTLKELQEMKFLSAHLFFLLFRLTRSQCFPATAGSCIYPDKAIQSYLPSTKLLTGNTVNTVKHLAAQEPNICSQELMETDTKRSNDWTE